MFDADIGGKLTFEPLAQLAHGEKTGIEHGLGGGNLLRAEQVRGQWQSKGHVIQTDAAISQAVIGAIPFDETRDALA